ncbi:MAG: S8 family serine peptidase, partial [Candidatus Hodarchaeales archaeon]
PNFTNFTKEIGATELWQNGYNGSNVIIAILDSGVDIIGGGNGDLIDYGDGSTESKFLGAVSMVPDEPLYYSDPSGRGTFHAGVACGTGNINNSHSGVAPGAQFLNVKVYDSIGITFWSFIISGMEWALSHGADVILFASTIPGLYVDPVSLAVNNIVDRGVFVVAPVGDDGPGYMSINTPGQAGKACKVGAYDSYANEVWSYSSRGPSFDFSVGPDILAPGVDIIGSRSRIMSTDSLDAIMEDYSSKMGVSDVFVDLFWMQFKDQRYLFDSVAQSIPYSQYGEEVPNQANYTRASGTGAAAAVVAGAAAILLGAFPLATPILIQKAIMETAQSISSSQDLNSEGAGFINIPAAFNWLSNVFEEASDQPDQISFSMPLVYAGIVTNMNQSLYSDLSSPLNYSQDGLQTYDTTALFSTQGMMATLLTTNSSDPYNSSIGYENLTSIHLPINQFGIEYSLSEQPDNSRFHWFSEFNVVREMHQCINDIFYQEGYSRYSGVLELEGLYVAVLVETWSYAGEYLDVDYLVNITNPFTGEEYSTDLVYQPLYNANRVSAFKISFNFMNYRSDEQTFQNVSLVSYFKGDLYLNEDHELNKVGNSADISSLQNFTYDDSVYYNSTTQTIFVEDTNNDTFYIRDDDVTAMGFQSLSHTISTFAIGESMGLLKNITLEHLQASDWNTDIGMDSFLHGREGLDPGFASAYTLSDLTFGTNLEFSGTLSVGQGTSSENARNIMQTQSELIKNQVTNYNVTDLMVVSANFSRIIEKDNEYNMEVLILNLGNMPVDETQLAFIVNRTNDEDVYEIYTMLFNIHDFNPFELRSYTASWVPLKTGAYTMGVVIGDIEEMYATFKLFSGFESGLSQDYRTEMSTREINYMSNALSRTIIVIDPSYYNSLKYDHFEVYPYFLDQNPMKIYAPLDYAIYNLTTFTIWPIEEVTIGTDGIGSKLVFFLDSDLSNSNIQPLNSIQRNLSPYSAIPLVIFANPLTPPGEIHFNITFTAPGSNSPFYYLPVNLVITANRGRIWFDAVHMNFFVSQNLVGQSDISLDAISTDSLDILDNFGNFEGKDFQTKEGVFDLTRLVDYSERLDTTWGSYFKLRQLWADPANSFDGMKGTSLYTIFPLLSLNFSDFIDFDALPSSTEENSNDEDYFFNTADIIPDTSFLGDTIGNYAFESDTLSTSTINHDLLQFFDGLVINDPEQGFLLEEIDDIDEWVENGGTLYVWAEDQY